MTKSIKTFYNTCKYTCVGVTYLSFLVPIGDLHLFNRPAMICFHVYHIIIQIQTLVSKNYQDTHQTDWVPPWFHLVRSCRLRDVPPSGISAVHCDKRKTTVLGFNNYQSSSYFPLDKLFYKFVNYLKAVSSRDTWSSLNKKQGTGCK